MYVEPSKRTIFIRPIFIRPIFIRKSVGALVLLLLATQSSSLKAAAITFNTALPVSQGEVIVREQLVVSRASASTTGVTRRVTRQVLNTVAGYGLTPKLAVFGILPVARARSSSAAGRVTDFGLADASVFARYEVYREDNVGTTVRVAPFLGLRVPTGDEGLLGDGTTDVFFGIIATAASTQRIVDAQLSFERSGDDAGQRAGHSAKLDLSLQYRLLPQEVTQRTNGFLYGVLESNLQYQQRGRLQGNSDPDSGGTQWFLTPGVQFVTQRWIADLAVKIPVVKTLNGTALEPDYSVLASIRFNF